MRSPDEAREALQDLIPGWCNLAVADSHLGVDRVYKATIVVYATTNLPLDFVNDESEESAMDMLLANLHAELQSVCRMILRHLDA